MKFSEHFTEFCTYFDAYFLHHFNFSIELRNLSDAHNKCRKHDKTQKSIHSHCLNDKGK